jgi:hypothetical protein
MTEGVVLALVVTLGIVGPLVLYYLVRAEHNQRETMDRQTAQQRARRDTRDRE